MLEERESGPVLISRDVAELIETFDGATLAEKLQNLVDERDEMVRETRRLKLDLYDERARSEQAEMQRRSVSGEPGAGTAGTATADEGDMKKLLHDYKFKLKKVEQENIILTGNVSRLETQLLRFKTAADEAEKTEEELKIEKRKILREVRNLISCNHTC